MVHTKQEVSHGIIDSIFSNPLFRRKFDNPRLAESICKMRADGMMYAHISKKVKVSQFTCIECVRKVVRLYRVFVEGNKNERD